MTHENYRITKITNIKGRIQNYIKFEVDRNIEFNDKKQSFIFLPNEQSLIINIFSRLPG